MKRAGLDPIDERLRAEVGDQFRPGFRRAAMVYPSPYRAGMSSLGYQWILSRLQERGIAAERVFLPDDTSAYRTRRQSPVSYETRTELRRFPILLVSLAYELELAGLIELLDLAGIPVLREERGPYDPVIVLGGPITFSNPLPCAPFVDAMLLGEADETTGPVVDAFFDSDTRDAFLDAVEAQPGGYVPERHGVRLPAVAKATDALLPARSHILAPEAELSNMFLLEGERGCHRSCTFCVMRRSTNGGMRLVTPERILSFVPEHAKKVGLVGAAISDHPKLVGLLDTLVRDGKQVSLSSLRADRVSLKPDIARLLRKSGAKTLTVASDAASQRLRRTISKGTVEKHLIRCAQLAGEHQFRVLKVYMMLGLPGEEDHDLDELIAFSRELAGYSRIALGVAPFVAKRMTPMDGTGFAGIKTVERRMKILQRGLKGKVDVRATSARWAWVEYMMAQGGPESGLAVLQAVRAGGRFAHYKRAFNDMNTDTFRPWAAFEEPLSA